jgi:hypothetical protein
VKKVRYAFGVAGFVPVLGLMTAGPSPAASHDARSPSKTVSLEAAQAVVPDAPCTGHTPTREHAGNFYFTVYRTPASHCIGGVSASVFGTIAPGLLLRTRIYSPSPNGSFRWFHHTTGGHINGEGYEISGYYQGIHEIRQAKQQMCEAIVSHSSSGKVLYGPVCLHF